MPLQINKRRLYIAYYIRGYVNHGDAQFHTGLLLSPKKPSLQSSGRPDTMRYHVTNSINKSGKQVWTYEGKKTFSQTTKLVAVLFLGKVANGTDIESILKRVPVVQNQPHWRCQHWVWSALDILVNEGILKLPGRGEVVWNTGVTFSLGHKKNVNPAKATPTCDTNGRTIESEFPAAGLGTRV
ncbi:hypothetical protein C8R46DRAFT_902324 [Mycena filopes]|nr:hypothetical protein C8R46DRAFT_902324 [Mycena filopes]